MLMVTPPGGCLRVAVTQASGKSGNLEIFCQTGWTNTAIYWGTDNKNYVASSSAESLANIRRILGAAKSDG